MEDDLPNDVVWVIDPNGLTPVLEITVYDNTVAAVRVARNPAAQGSWKNPIRHFSRLAGLESLSLEGLLKEELQPGEDQFGIKAMSLDEGNAAYVRMAIRQGGKIVKAIGADGSTLNPNGDHFRSIPILVATSSELDPHYFSISVQQ